jgi:hypothetical protein
LGDLDCLIESLHLVEIMAYPDSGAYTIFETMNDRGLSLTPADMLLITLPTPIALLHRTATPSGYLKCDWSLLKLNQQDSYN